MAELRHLFEKLALGETLSPGEVVELTAWAHNAQVALAHLNQFLAPGGGLRVDVIETKNLEVSGDMTAFGGDITANSKSAGEDSRFNLQNQGVQKSLLWFDTDLGTLTLENMTPNSGVVLAVEGAQASDFVEMLDRNASQTRFRMVNDGSFWLYKTNSDPAYQDGYALLYFYSDGAGVDELRLRGKIGATETQVSLADLSP